MPYNYYDDQETRPKRPATGQQPAQPVQTQPMASPTFANLQATGMPRPAPVMYPTSPKPPKPAPYEPNYGGVNPPKGKTLNFQGIETHKMPKAGGVPKVSAGGFSAQLAEALARLLGNPSSYGTDAVRGEYDRFAAQIDDDTTLRMRALEGEMAARGLSDSNIYGDRTRELNFANRDAKVQLAQHLAQKLAETQAADLRSAIALQLGAEEGALERALRADALNTQMGERRREFDLGLDFDRDQFDFERDIWNDRMQQEWFDLLGGTEFVPSSLPGYNVPSGDDDLTGGLGGSRFRNFIRRARRLTPEELDALIYGD